MKIFGLITVLSIVSSASGHCSDNKTQSIKTDALEKLLRERDTNEYIYTTKFGDVKFVRGDGSLGALAKSITLKDKTSINVKNEKDAQGSSPSLMEELMKASSTEYEPRIVGQSGKRRIRRMVVLVGPDGTCVKQFMILDFTGTQAFVSERFGYNPQDKSCLSFKRAKWGKSESTITLDGPMTYVYYTGGKVIGPI